MVNNPGQLGPAHRRRWWRAGALWLGLTVGLELLMGRFVLGRPWGDVLAVFRFWKGDLFLLVLLVTGFAPWIAARLRGLELIPPRGPAP